MRSVAMNDWRMLKYKLLYKIKHYKQYRNQKKPSNKILPLLLFPAFHHIFVFWLIDSDSTLRAVNGIMGNRIPAIDTMTVGLSCSADGAVVGTVGNFFFAGSAFHNSYLCFFFQRCPQV